MHTCAICGRSHSGLLCPEMWFDFVEKRWYHGDEPCAPPGIRSLLF